MIGSIVLDLSHSPGNPRNSEGAFATLSDGQVLQDSCVRRITREQA